MKDLYGSGILFFYFFKWPYVFGFPYLYYVKGMQDNYILNALWFYCLFLIFKDFYTIYRDIKAKKARKEEEQKSE
jgi:hypothetical protein